MGKQVLERILTAAARWRRGMESEQECESQVSGCALLALVRAHLPGSTCQARNGEDFPENVGHQKSAQERRDVKEAKELSGQGPENQEHKSTQKTQGENDKEIHLSSIEAQSPAPAKLQEQSGETSGQPPCQQSSMPRIWPEKK